jgi:hypothetical protein
MHDGRPRFIVVSTTGHIIDVARPRSGATNHAPPTSYSVLDRGYCHREVYRATSRAGDESRKRQAEARCAALNATFDR